MNNIIIYKLSNFNDYKRYIIYYYQDINQYRWSNWVSGHNIGEIIKYSGDATFLNGILLLKKYDIDEIENNYKKWNYIDNYIDSLPVMKGVINISKLPK